MPKNGMLLLLLPNDIFPVKSTISSGEDIPQRVHRFRSPLT
jgi:hypothetical protein